MISFVKKAKDYFEVGYISQCLNKFDVSCTNYFKSLSAINDYVLASKRLFAKDHGSRFSLLKKNFPYNYKITSSLFLLYRRTYTKEVNSKDSEYLLKKLMEVFESAKIEIPSVEGIKKEVKKTFGK